MLGHIMWVIYNDSLHKPCMMLSVDILLILPASNECEREALSIQVLPSYTKYVLVLVQVYAC